ncbi:MAG: polysaccharide deacetylase family protein [Chloroflexi bacterium]|nr:polysaccharide deacetylase family protein [Chloroflexota bacterium]
MNTKLSAHRVLPPLHRLGRRSIGLVRQRWLATIVGCQTEQRLVALTFDDGPSEYTPAVLNVLDHYGVKATFFMLGRNAAFRPELVQAVHQRGHAIGNHTYSHPRMSEISLLENLAELRRCQQVIAQATGQRPQVMRPPQGAQSTISVIVSRLLGLQPVHWSASGDDWRGDPAAVVAERVLRRLRPGSIILLHDGLEPAANAAQQPDYSQFRDRSATVEALPVIIESLQAQGYQFLTVPQLIENRPLMRKAWFV